ncbi:DNA internalization-related competence protein ComEC/Rec2 [Sporolactobacillus shoreae]|uniref:DNA internalization-related competence protein ComEC/Rec2 n=1 Tax=Sporolactobacillus shoreae TaxID=1465501 RepID=A0A4Z0GTL9_9BACL|nr:DNA internalization-related competence protein ComEC/Rec2 [Sporolactobacillus shoreae]TGA99562.1 DNA internalization-related competence protein ComEC/Rec2 [Sporolactobacillus shoreae]
MPFASKWHLIAFCACLSSWAAGRNPSVPVLLLGLYSIYLLTAKKYRLFAVFIVVILAIMLDVQLFQTNGTVLSPDRNVFIGKIKDIPLFDGDLLSYTLKDSGEDVRVSVKLRSEEEKNRLMKTLRPGLICRIEGQLERPPGATNFHAFDYRAYLENNHIFWLLKAKGPPQCVGSSLSIWERLNRFRQSQMERIQNQFSPTSAGIMNALIFGDDRSMDPDLADAYRLFGLVHLLVVSGMHIAAIFGFLYFVARRLGVVKEHACLILLLFIPFYVFLAGAEPSAVRSGLTAGLVLTAGIAKIKNLRTTDVLSISCLIMVFQNPKVVFDLGFQLSFAVTFTVMIAGPAIIEKYKSALLRIFMLSMISEIASFPIAVYHFYQFSFVGLFLSIFFVPYMTFIILPLSVLAYVGASILPAASRFLSPTMDLFLYVPHEVLLYLYRHPFFQLNYGAMEPWMLASAILIFAAALLIWENSRKILTAALPALSFLLIYGIIYAADFINPYGSVTFLDVGQGDNILIRLPHRQGTLLIDSGGTMPYPKKKWQIRNKPYEVGRDVVLHELQAMRINSLDRVVFTHKDFDHVGGMRSVLDVIPVRRIVVSPFYNPDQSDLKLFEDALNRGSELSLMKSGDRLMLGHAVFDILSPITASSDSNDNSMVIRTMLGGKHWLFTGDLPIEGELRLIEQNSDLKADILKLGHHGSRTSTSEKWLEKVNPALGIISVGKNNRYGHPHPEVLQLLKKHQVGVIRTDQSGAIQFLFTDQKIVRMITALGH